MSGSALSIADRPHVVASIRDVTARAEQRRILDGLHDVTTELMDARETQEIADVVVDTAERVFGYEAAGVQRLSGEAPPTTELVAASDTWRRLGNPSSSDRSHGPIERVWSEREPEIVDDLRSVDPSVEYDPIRSALCLPLGAEGVLSVESTAVGEFSETDIELVEILTSNATVALTRAERDRTLRERTRDLSALFENTTDSIADVEFVDGGRASATSTANSSGCSATIATRFVGDRFSNSPFRRWSETRHRTTSTGRWTGRRSRPKCDAKPRPADGTFSRGSSRSSATNRRSVRTSSTPT